MAPFEPKTDSKEFETAALDQSAVSRTTGSGPDSADLTIRIWRHEVGGGVPALNWGSESVFVYMVADLVTASRGRIVSDLPSSLTAHFDNYFQALVAARRIQTAALEFLNCRPGDYAGSAVLIHPTAASGFSPGLAQNAMQVAEPGQIILSEEVSRRLQDVPGIELRAVPALTTGGTAHIGLSELLWTSPDRFASLRDLAKANPPAANTGTAFGATMIVNAPIAASRPDSPRTKAQPVGVVQGDRPDPGLGVLAENRADDTEGRRSSTGTRLLVGAIAVVVVGVAVALFYPRSVSKPPVKPDAPTATQPSSGHPSEPVTAQPPGVPPVTDAHPKPQPPVVKQPVPVVKQPAPPKPQPQVVQADKDKAPPPKPQETPIQGFEGNSTYDGMTQRDIPRLLQWARSDAGNGNYQKAAQEYRVILQLQPNNPDAKEGLRKIQLAQGGNQ